MANPPTGTVTFLSTDIEGSTRLWENHPTQMNSALRRHDEIMRAVVEAHEGYVFKTTGDGCFSAFGSARWALEATLEAQRNLFAEEWDEMCRLRVRMALHTGVAEEHGDDYFGPPVNRVARLLSAGHGGQILMSDATYNLVRDHLIHLEPGAELRDMGEHRLRDLRYTERIFQLVVPDLPADFPELRTHGRVTPRPSDTYDLKPETGPERYRIKEPLGGGGMAEVYLAHDEELDRDVAYKKLRRQYADDEQFVERFRREARSAASLSHPNIVNIYDRGKTRDGSYYIVMECVTGGTLKDRILSHGPLPAPEAAAIALQVARSLQAAHRHDLIHRDVKPQNILLTESGDVKVADFGIAQATSEASLTVEGVTPGTPHYISPEQARGKRATARSDLYSLGIVLYEMLTGRLPYDAETQQGILWKHMHELPRPPKELNPLVPEGINTVVTRLLAKDPEERYADVTGLIEDLERASREEQVVDGGRSGASGHTVVDDGSETVGPDGEQLDSKGQDTEDDVGEIAVDLGRARQEDRQEATNGGRTVVDDGREAVRTEDRRRQEGLGGGTSSSTTVRGGGARGSGDPLQWGVLPWILGAAGLVAVTVLAFVLFRPPGPDSSTFAEVPSLTDQTLAEARQTADGFKVVARDGGASGTDEVVLTQDPPGGEQTPSGSTIYVTLGNCEDQLCVPVPPITDRSVRDARNILENSGLSLGNESKEPSDTVSKGQIINQSPPAGSQALQDSFVNYTVSTGP